MNSLVPRTFVREQKLQAVLVTPFGCPLACLRIPRMVVLPQHLNVIETTVESSSGNSIRDSIRLTGKKLNQLRSANLYGMNDTESKPPNPVRNPSLPTHPVAPHSTNQMVCHDKQ